ncbi:MAG: glycosyltransferase [Flavobacteriia bacterium]|nr:glycosyltransferase [Flavobacteriia bacterium]
MDTKKDLSVVIPVHNGEQTIEELFQRLMNVLSKYSENVEIIFVDDCSKDGSWKIIRSLKASFPLIVRGIRFARNYGQHNATLCGIKHTTSDIIITIDDDLEFPPESIHLLMEKYYLENQDVVYGVNKNKKVSVVRKQLTFLFRKLQGLAEKYVVRGSSLRLMKGEIARAIIVNAQEFSFIDEFLLWYTSAISVVDIESERLPVKTRYKITGLMRMTKDLIYLSSSVPLKLVTVFGFLMMAGNFLAGIIVVYRRLVLSIDVKGYTSIIVAILFSSGMIIFCLGVIAEHIGKILKVSYKKPAFFESEIA